MVWRELWKTWILKTNHNTMFSKTIWAWSMWYALPISIRLYPLRLASICLIPQADSIITTDIEWIVSIQMELVTALLLVIAESQKFWWNLPRCTFILLTLHHQPSHLSWKSHPTNALLKHWSLPKSPFWVVYSQSWKTTERTRIRTRPQFAFSAETTVNLGNSIAHTRSKTLKVTHLVQFSELTLVLSAKLTAITVTLSNTVRNTLLN